MLNTGSWGGFWSPWVGWGLHPRCGGTMMEKGKLPAGCTQLRAELAQPPSISWHRAGERREPRRSWVVLEQPRGCRAPPQSTSWQGWGRNSQIQVGIGPACLGGGGGVVQAGCSGRDRAWEEGTCHLLTRVVVAFASGPLEAQLLPHRGDRVPPPYPASIKDHKSPANTRHLL